eukprot:11948099-Karenia_brevis.AAC.1
MSFSDKLEFSSQRCKAIRCKWNVVVGGAGTTSAIPHWSSQEGATRPSMQGASVRAKRSKIPKAWGARTSKGSSSS